MQRRNGDTVRAFIAVEIPGEAKELLKQVQEVLMDRLGHRGVRWSPVGNAHLTLCFLGDVETSRMAELNGQLDAACAALDPFETAIRGAGCFPNARSPSVLWAGVDDDAKALTSLAQAAKEASRSLCAKLDQRPYRAHITLARMRPGFRHFGDLEKLVAGAARESRRWLVDRAILFQSELSADGAVYTPLHVSRLAPSP